MRLIAAILVALPLLCKGQGNLVPNGSFEIHSDCTGPFRIWLAPPWLGSGPICSPDYFNECAVAYYCVPQNNSGFQYAQSGVAYGGFFAYSTNSNSGREFVQVELTEPIVAGVRYEVVFHVSLADSFLYAVSTLGAHFSTNQIVRNDYSIVGLGLVSQVNSEEGMVFDDKENWVEVRDTFNSRDGGERFITIGNFNLDAESGVVFVGNGDHDFTHAYYYIDDVSVIALDSIPNSIAEPATEPALTLTAWPNPATLLLHIRSGLPLARLRLLDLSGRAVHAQEAHGTTHTIPLHTLPAGLYLLEAEDTTGHKAVQRVVVQ
jgi:hypothetical protein